MKIKTPLTLAAMLVAGFVTSGCSQMSAQQVAQPATLPTTQPSETTPPQVQVVNDCSKCGTAPSTKPATGTAHTHPAIPGCTDSTTHTHPFTNPAHQHAYSCKGGKKVTPAAPHRVDPAPIQPIAPIRPVQPIKPPKKYYPAQPVQPVQPVAPVVVVPKVKAKGNYRGPVQIDQGIMMPYKK